MFYSLGEVSLGEFQTSSTVDGGCVGFLFGSLGEFSLGEFCVTVTPPTPSVTVSGGGLAIPLRKMKPLDDDEIALILISQQLAQTFWKQDD